MIIIKYIKFQGTVINRQLFDDHDERNVKGYKWHFYNVLSLTALHPLSDTQINCRFYVTAIIQYSLKMLLKLAENLELIWNSM